MKRILQLAENNFSLKEIIAQKNKNEISQIRDGIDFGFEFLLFELLLKTLESSTQT